MSSAADRGISRHGLVDADHLARKVQPSDGDAREDPSIAITAMLMDERWATPHQLLERPLGGVAVTWCAHSGAGAAMHFGSVYAEHADVGGQILAGDGVSVDDADLLTEDGWGGVHLDFVNDWHGTDQI